MDAIDKNSSGRNRLTDGIVRHTVKHMEDDMLKGWCKNCNCMQAASERSEPDDMYCEVCDEALKPIARMSPGELAASRFMAWSARMAEEGKWGPSPGGAAGMLSCSRAMIDDLVRSGVLERSEYKADGHLLIMISERSITKARENKKRTGRWTGFPKGFDPDEYE